MTSAPAIADWRLLAQSKRDNLAATIPAAWRLPTSMTSQFHEGATLNVLDVPQKCGLLTPHELEITEKHDATQLVELMAAGTLKSIDVVTAFCKRAAIAQQCVNCLTETMFDSALARARECDSHFARTGTTLGPLHGLPISLKDSFNVRGVQSTIGYVSFIAHPPIATNGVLVDMLIEAGAVLYVKTNLPQTMMTADSHNNVFGRTLNPWNLSCTAGGSTGGEAALAAMRGSVLGVATDIAGSIRIPALCCGISGFKPTSLRVPFAGNTAPGALGSPSPIAPVIGPCGRSSRDYTLFLRSILTSTPTPWARDFMALNIPFRTPATTPPPTPLKFGLITTSPSNPTHPPILRALERTASLLEEKGHTVIRLDSSLPPLDEAALLAFKFFNLDPDATPLKHLRAANEPPVPSLSICTLPELRDWTPSVADLWDMTRSRAQFRAAWHALLMSEGGLDALIIPGYQATAPKHDVYGIPQWTVIGNLLDYPAAILPFGTADEELDAPFFKSNVTYEPAYDPKAVQGSPAHIQLMGKPLMDEELLGVMHLVEGVLAGGKAQ